MAPHRRKRIPQPPPPRSAPRRLARNPLPAKLEAQAHMLAAADALFRTRDRVAGIIERRARGRDGVLTATDVLRPMRRARRYDLQFAQLARSVSEDLTPGQTTAQRADGAVDPKEIKKRDELKEKFGELCAAASRERAGPGVSHPDTAGPPSPPDDREAQRPHDMENDKTNPP
jgi:hypothetical protein